ncbi:protein HOTHEAD-like [Pyrus x bretschneideri]|uniref:protein HOTHEAD-like n=1 Tax=Pyrus x bretschneideri TaxID=225117 RepID=UPI00202E4E39|nr:protein HOTHEAD-like [Pyrus x bretschneideri]
MCTTFFEAYLLAGILLLLPICYSDKAPDYTFVREAISAPAVVHYDYIVIGGGTAGCPLAATLSHGATVLVLERGGSPYGNPNIINIDKFAPTLLDISPTSPAQQFTSEDGVFNIRARVLGGGSAVNAGFYTRASTHYIKEVGWNQRMVNQSYEWVEKVVAFEPEILQWETAFRDGLLEVGVLPHNGFTYEHLYGTKVGGSIFDADGHRHTAADLLQYADPRKINVYLNARVQKILFRHIPGRLRPQAYGVIYRDAHGIRHYAYLKMNSKKNEIILSAGAIGSPQLLMLSGVGPAFHLRAHGIKVVADQPMVGQGMADNPMNLLLIPSPQPVEVSLVQVVGITKFESYIEGASGLTLPIPLAHRLSNHFKHFLSQPEHHPFRASPKIMAWAADTVNGIVNKTLRAGVILEKIMGPLSTGHLALRNTNPDDNPFVTFNYFKEPEDLRKCIEGMRTIIDVVNSKAYSKFRYKNMPVEALINLMLTLPVNGRRKHANATFSLEQFCIDTVMTIWHYHGGCQVGRVVDKGYRVLGIDSLRVVDGSTFYRTPGTNPQATVMMLGRYMGQRILHDRLLRGSKNKN